MFRSSPRPHGGTLESDSSAGRNKFTTYNNN